MVDAVALLESSSAKDRATGATILGRSTRRWPAGATEALDRLARHDEFAEVRAATATALVRRARTERAIETWRRATHDQSAEVRLAATRLATEAKLAAAPGLVERVGDLVDDDAHLVAEQACFALGELVDAGAPGAATVVALLAATAHDHHDALVREAAVAALGSIAHPDGRAAVLAACNDKPAVRRRAVLALTVFDGADVDAALRAALTDRDWQVRQAAEDVLEEWPD